MKNNYCKELLIRYNTCKKKKDNNNCLYYINMIYFFSNNFIKN